MASFSNNVTTKVSAAISNSISASSGTLYTVPANSYAIFQVHFDPGSSNGAYTVQVAGRTVWTAYQNSTSSIDYSSTGGRAQSNSAGFSSGVFYAGPGQAISFTRPAVSTVYISGTVFINTP